MRKEKFEETALREEAGGEVLREEVDGDAQKPEHT